MKRPDLEVKEILGFKKEGRALIDESRLSNAFTESGKISLVKEDEDEYEGGVLIFVGLIHFSIVQSS